MGTAGGTGARGQPPRRPQCQPQPERRRSPAVLQPHRDEQQPGRGGQDLRQRRGGRWLAQRQPGKRHQRRWLPGPATRHRGTLRGGSPLFRKRHGRRLRWAGHLLRDLPGRRPLRYPGQPGRGHQYGGGRYYPLLLRRYAVLEYQRPAHDGRYRPVLQCLEREQLERGHQYGPRLQQPD